MSTVLQANIVLSKTAASTSPSPLRASTTASKKRDHTPDISFTELVRGFNELIPNAFIHLSNTEYLLHAKHQRYNRG